MNDFASLDTLGDPGGVKVVKWNQNQLIRSLCSSHPQPRYFEVVPKIFELCYFSSKTCILCSTTSMCSRTGMCSRTVMSSITGICSKGLLKQITDSMVKHSVCQCIEKFKIRTFFVYYYFGSMWFTKVGLNFWLHFYCSEFCILLTTYPPLNANVICESSPTPCHVLVRNMKTI